MPRKVKEWIGKTDDTMPPPSVRLRIFEQHGGRCQLTGKKILVGDKWDLDHIVPLADGGENRESKSCARFTFCAPAKDDEREQNTSKSKTKRDQTVWHEAAKTEITVQKTDGWNCGFS